MTWNLLRLGVYRLPLLLLQLTVTSKISYGAQLDNVSSGDEADPANGLEKGPAFGLDCRPVSLGGARRQRINSTSSTGSTRRRRGRYATSPSSRRALSIPSYSPYTTSGYGFINNFGQTSKQLFKKPHPAKKVGGLSAGSRSSSGIEMMTLPLVAGQAAMQILPIHLPSTGDGSS